MKYYITKILATYFLCILIASAQVDSEHILYDLAKNNYKSSHFDSALDYINKYINMNKTNSDAWCLKGMILVAKGLDSNDPDKYRSAILSFKEAIRLRQKNHLAWMGEADAQYYLKEYVNALGNYNVSIEVNSSSARAWFQKGTVLTTLGWVGDVGKCCVRAVSLDSKYRNIVPCKSNPTNPDGTRNFLILLPASGTAVPANQTLVLVNRTIFMIDSRALENVPRVPEPSPLEPSPIELRRPLGRLVNAPLLSRADERIDSRALENALTVLEPSPIELRRPIGRFISAPLQPINGIVAPANQTPTPSNETVVTAVQGELLLNRAFITWDFETGDLGGWNRTGNAFDYQPTYGDNPTARGDNSSNHQGDYWIGTYEKYQGAGLGQYPGDSQGDGPTGTLTSLPFVIKGESIDFLIGGGKNCSANLVVDGATVLTASGNDSETMSRVEWNVSAFKEREATIMLVDNSSSTWGHINFDDVVFDVFPDVKGSIPLELSLNEKGYTLYQLGMYEDALVYFDRALKVDPFYITALKNKGMALKSLGRQNESELILLDAEKLEGA